MAHDAINQRRFAHAISPYQAGALPAIQFEIDVPQNMFLPIVLINGFYT
jgi:hypothetical protein